MEAPFAWQRTKPQGSMTSNPPRLLGFFRPNSLVGVGLTARNRSQVRFVQARVPIPQHTVALVEQ